MKTLHRIAINHSMATFILQAALTVFPYTVLAQDEPVLSRHQAMAQINRLSQPIEDHRYLNPLAGEWRGEGMVRILPELDFEPITCRLVARWVLGERFLEQTLKCVGEGYKFEGQGFLGFDRLSERFVGTWMDKTDTGYTAIKGHRLNTGTFVLTHHKNNALTMEKDISTSTITISNPHSYTHKSTVIDKKTGESVVLLKIIYTR